MTAPCHNVLYVYVWMLCYLGSAIVVTSFVLGKHTSVEERYPGTTPKL